MNTPSVVGIAAGLLSVGSFCYGDAVGIAGMLEVDLAAASPVAVKNVAVNSDGTLTVRLVADDEISADTARFTAGSAKLVFEPDADGVNEDVLVGADGATQPTATGAKVGIGSGDSVSVWLKSGQLYVQAGEGEYYTTTCGTCDKVELLGSTLCDVHAYVPSSATVSDSSSNGANGSDGTKTKSTDSSSAGTDGGAGVRQGGGANRTDGSSGKTDNANASDALQIVPVNADYHYTSK
jgi:hypothetical protein